MNEERNLSVEPATNEQLERMARAVLECSVDGLPPTNVCVLAIGWLRAAHAQMMAIAGLVEAGGASMKAPNVRAFAELAIRIVWLHELEDRTAAMPILVAEAQGLDQKFVRHASDMGFTTDGNAPLQALDPETLGTLDRSLSSEARGVAHAAKSAKHVVGLYALWNEATQFSHATTTLAEEWVALDGGLLHVWEPASNEWEASMHLVSVMMCGFVGQILIAEGASKEAALRFVSASLSGLRPA
ncbi:hypothetical protein [Agromyces bauzanensis]